MLWIVVSIIVALLVGYCTWVLFFNLDEADGTTDLSNYIRDAPVVDGTAPKSSALSKYCTAYEEPGKQLLILYGTEYGFSEEIARKLFDRIADGESYQELSWQPRVLNSKDFERIDFSKEQVLLCVFSTTGDGVPPTDSLEFFEALNSDNAPDLSHTHYSVLALGDYNYPYFCRTGKQLDTKLSNLGSQCLHSRVDIDLEDWPAINGWMDGALEGLAKLQLITATDYLDLTQLEEESGHSRTRPFLAEMTVKYSLTQMDSSSDKETLHTEFDLTGSELQFTSGDALGIYPQNNPPEVDTLIKALHSTGDQLIAVPMSCYSPKPEGDTIELREALIKYYDLKTIKIDLMKLLVDSVADKEEKKRGNALLKDGLSKKNAALTAYLAECEVIDVLTDFSSFHCTVQEVVSQLRPLQPRYYSIASSPKKDPNVACVCAAVVRYTLQATPRTGVCTTFLQDRFTVGDKCPVFISRNPDFRLPPTHDVPVIMIGPGTGIAPFRAFIQERLLSECKSQSVLYFGCRHKDKDFLYKDELEKLATEGKLVLRTAFSRDQPQKIYVQDLVKEDGEMLWELMEAGAHVYVCGDAVHMAGDVHEALLGVIEREGGLDRQGAEHYMEELEKTARYQRDVWVT